MTTLFGPTRPKLPEPFDSMTDAELCVKLTGHMGVEWEDGPVLHFRVWRCPPGLLAPQAESAREYVKSKFTRIPAIDFEEAWSRAFGTEAASPSASARGVV